MTAAEELGNRDFAIFSVLIYLRAWISVSNAAEAPLTDFRLICVNFSNISTKASLQQLVWRVSFVWSKVFRWNQAIVLAAMEEEAYWSLKYFWMTKDKSSSALPIQRGCSKYWTSRHINKIMRLKSSLALQSLMIRADRGAALIQEFNKWLT